MTRESSVEMKIELHGVTTPNGAMVNACYAAALRALQRPHIQFMRHK